MGHGRGARHERPAEEGASFGWGKTAFTELAGFEAEEAGEAADLAHEVDGLAQSRGGGEPFGGG